MSVITFAWTPAEAAAPVVVPKQATETSRREREFRDALERYAAGYGACQVSGSGAIGRGGDAKGLPWLRALRRLSAATCEIWLFSREICDDWRTPGRYGDS